MKNKTNEELIRAYENEALAHGKATDESDPAAANKAADLIAAIYHELRERGHSAQSLLLPLLEFADPRIRVWAGAHALDFAPTKGVPVLQGLAKEEPWVGFDAKMTLKLWREGKLTFT